MRFSALALTLAVCLPELQATTATAGSCPAGVLIADVNLMVVHPGEATPKPLRTVNRLLPGYFIDYTPNGLPGSGQKKAEVALLLAPPGGGKLITLESKPASKPVRWTVPSEAATVALVYGPQGLNERKINSVDPQVVSQLADYADKTTQTEALIGALMQYNKAPNGTENLEAALMGFSSRFGLANTRLDRTRPMDEQAGLLLQTLNPALSNYDPLAPKASVRLQQSASLAASVAALFFGNTVGLAAGGTSMLLNLRTLMFPNVEFRSSFAQASSGPSLTLCARPEAKSRTRLGYLWATRLPDSGPPEVSLASAAHVPLGVKTKLPLKTEAPLLARAGKWSLVSGRDDLAIPVRATGKDVELDLTNVSVPPGTYHLTGTWDWDRFTVEQDVHVHAMPAFKAVRPEPASQDKLIEKSGIVPVSFAGDDFQFVQRASLRSATDKRMPAQSLPLQSKPSGPEPVFQTEIDTSQLAAGQYLLALSQPGDNTREVPVRVLPANPAIRNLPLRVNLKEGMQVVELQGTGLDRIERATATGADVAFLRANNKSALQVRLPQSASRGEKLDLQLKVEGVQGIVTVPAALEIAGPRPRIRSVTASVPENLGVALREKELPAGSFTTFSLLIDASSSQPYVGLQCRDRNATLQPVRLRAGEQQASARVEQSGTNSLFLSVDPASIGGVGCTLMASVETDGEGKSDAYMLGRVVRLPRIESFEMTLERSGENAYVGVLKGQDLETIEKAGWTAEEGMKVTELPAPIAREGAKQMLKVALPWPPPAPRSPVYVWLRGERSGRVTDAKY